MRVLPSREPLAIARTVAGEYAAELIPVNRSEFPVAGGLVVAKQLVGECQAEVMALRHCGIDEPLPQRVIGEALDLPSHGRIRMVRLRVRRTEHHQARPPPA